MDGTEPSVRLKKGGGLAASLFFALKDKLGHLIAFLLLYGMWFMVEMTSRVSGSCRLLSIASICCLVLLEHHIYFDNE